MLLIYLRDANIRGYNEKISLSYTVSGDNLILISYLLKRDIDINLVNTKGRLSLLYLINEENYLFIYNSLISVSVDLDYKDDNNNIIMLRHAALSNIKAL